LTSTQIASTGFDGVADTIEHQQRIRSKYASPAMKERRQRMLSVALEMIGEDGVAAFNVRTFCDRAEVSPRTLYYTFGSKEDVIIAAIEHHFDKFRDSLPPPPYFGDLDAVLRQLESIGDIVVRERRYAAAMVEVFFTSNGTDNVRNDLMRMAVGWVAQGKDKGVVGRISDTEREAVQTLLINAGYANVGDFVFGRISERTFRLRAQVNVLMIGLKIFRPAIQTQARRILNRLFGELD
jgi:AcrR family transcriptional regulator